MKAQCSELSPRSLLLDPEHIGGSHLCFCVSSGPDFETLNPSSSVLHLEIVLA